MGVKGTQVFKCVFLWVLLIEQLFCCIWVLSASLVSSGWRVRQHSQQPGFHTTKQLLTSVSISFIGDCNVFIFMNPGKTSVTNYVGTAWSQQMNKDIYKYKKSVSCQYFERSSRTMTFLASCEDWPAVFNAFSDRPVELALSLLHQLLSEPIPKSASLPKEMAVVTDTLTCCPSNTLPEFWAKTSMMSGPKVTYMRPPLPGCSG